MKRKGGRRPGAGRKPKPKLPFAPKAQADLVLDKLGSVHQGKKLPTADDLWLQLLTSKDERIKLDTLKYLTDRREGKPIQRIAGEDGGPVAVAVKVEFVDPDR